MLFLASALLFPILFLVAVSTPSYPRASAYQQGQIAPHADACNFDISLSPADVSLIQGQFTTVTANILRPVGACIAVYVALSAYDVPNGLTLDFSPNPVPDIAPPRSTITITVSESIAPGTYAITIRGTSTSSVYYTPNIFYIHQEILTVEVKPVTSTTTPTPPTTTSSSETSSPFNNIAGFPVESIIAGILIGVGMVSVIRRKRVRKPAE